MRGRRATQTQFLDRCLQGDAPLHDVLRDLNIPHATLAGWFTQRWFRKRVHALARYLVRTRELQLQIGSWRAAQLLSGAIVAPPQETTSAHRTACVELIKLARDSRARRFAERRRTRADRATLAHPDVGERESLDLAGEIEAPGA
jgi:hypothetical protein